MAETVSYWGFDEPTDGVRYYFPTTDKYAATIVGKRTVFFAKESVQRIPVNEIAVITHRFLKNKNHRLFLEEEFKEWCKQYDIDYRIPHWRITCVERWEY
jgi:hypothetical protein